MCGEFLIHFSKVIHVIQQLQQNLKYFFVFYKDLYLVKYIKTWQIYLSDHAPLHMTLRSFEKKSGYLEI